MFLKIKIKAFLCIPFCRFCSNLKLSITFCKNCAKKLKNILYRCAFSFDMPKVPTFNNEPILCDEYSIIHEFRIYLLNLFHIGSLSRNLNHRWGFNNWMIVRNKPSLRKVNSHLIVLRATKKHMRRSLCSLNALTLSINTYTVMCCKVGCLL